MFLYCKRWRPWSKWQGNGKFIRTILNMSHRIKGYLNNQNLRKREMHLGFRDSQNPTCVCQGHALSPLSSSECHFSFNHQKLISFTWRYSGHQGAWALLIVVPISREEPTLFLSPFHKNPREDSFGLSFRHVLTSWPITCGQSEAESWKKQGGSWITHGWSWGRSSSQRRKHCYWRRGEYRTEETT